jgi:hypothetical protein
MKRALRLELRRFVVNQDNWKTWLLIFVLSVGAAFELIKRVPQSEGNLWERDGSTLQMNADGQPYAIRTAKAPAVLPVQKRAQPTHVAAETVLRDELKKFVAANAQHATSAKAPKKKAVAKKKKKVAGPDDEIFIDPKTGKKYRRKKKKDKKTEVAKVKDDETRQYKVEDKANSEDIDNNLNAALFTGGITDDGGLSNYTAGNGGVTNNNTKSLEDWEAILLAKPDAAETKRFIQLYNQSQVSSQIFYKVAQAMLADKRADMRKLGILCAGSTPSVQSFQLLATAESTETDTGVKSYEDGFLALYSDLGNLPILQKVLNSNSQPVVTTQALQRLETAATRYLSGTSTAPSGQPSAQSAAHNATYFQRFVTILTDLSKSSNATVVSQAQQTLTSLQTLLAAAGSTTVAAKRRS